MYSGCTPLRHSNHAIIRYDTPFPYHTTDCTAFCPLPPRPPAFVAASISIMNSIPASHHDHERKDLLQQQQYAGWTMASSLQVAGAIGLCLSLYAGECNKINCSKRVLCAVKSGQRICVHVVHIHIIRYGTNDVVGTGGSCSCFHMYMCACCSPV